MITKEQLQVMSDFEVNKALHLARLTKKPMKDLESINFRYSAFDVRFKSGSNFLSHLKDYCKNPNDIMPLAFEYGISLMYCNEQDGWMGIKNNMTGVSHHFTDTSPLRAIACCLILVLQEKQK